MPEYRQEEHYESACNRTGGCRARIMDEPGQDAVNGISGQIQAAKIGKGIEAIHTRIIISHYLQSDQNAGDS